ncbi:MAG: nucleotidyltransferase family protein [Vicinamibacterales bacterium]
MQPDVGRLRAAARPVGDGSRWKVLSPAHMVVHSAVHGFHDGEMVNPLGDILDIHQLVSEFTTRDSSFPNHLIEEGRRMGVQVPLGHALRAATRWFGPMAPGFPEPGSLPSSARIVDACIDAMVRRSVVPPRELGRSGAGLAMYMRSHWLKMPPLLLARHLTVKLLARRKEGARPDLVGRA